MRPLALLLALPSLSACAVGEEADYFHFAIGNHWEYYLNEGGVDGEHWFLEIQDADDNPETQRGDFYFNFYQTVPNSVPQQPDLQFFLRRFNFSVETATADAGEEVALGFIYRWAPEDEGERDEFVVKVPEDGADWYDSWEYGGSTGTTETTYEVAEWRRADPVQTPHGTYTDCVDVERTLTQVSQQGQGEITTVQVREETWANGVGLVRYRITAVDGGVSEGLLRETNVAERLGGE
jgi:hypothetical protein